MLFRIVKRWPVASCLLLLHAVVWFTTACVFYTSHAPERQWAWVYEIMAGYPLSLMVSLLADGGDAAFAATLLFLGTLQWSIIGAVIDTIIHRVRRVTSPNI